MFEVFRAVVLGVVQGLTEFLPISSSAHLVLVPFLFGWDKPTLAFDVALHYGTLAAVVLYFRAELYVMARGLIGLDRSPDGQTYRRLGLLLVAASVPVAAVGYVAEDLVTEAFESPLVASLLLLVTAALLTAGEQVRNRRAARDRRAVQVARKAAEPLAGAPDPIAAPLDPLAEPHADELDRQLHAAQAAERLPKGDDPEDPKASTLETMTLRQSIVVGLMQCLALLPGISRSGSTITAGLFSGMTRPAATRFSFLLSLPALVGAGVLKLGELTQPQEFSVVAILAGVLAAFVAGYLAIAYLVALVSRSGLLGFARYCVVAAAIGIVASFTLA